MPLLVQRITSKWDRQFPLPFKLTITPEADVVRKGADMTVDIKLIMLKGGMTLHEIVVIDVVGGPSNIVVINATSPPSLFGIDPKELPTVEVQGVLVPQLLVDLQRHLYDNGGLDIVGIFRLAPDELEVKRVQGAINRGTYTGCRDVNCIANLIKVWLRELPEQLLSDIPVESLLNISNADHSRALVDQMPEAKRHILIWLVRLLGDIVQNEEVNKMNPQNCGKHLSIECGCVSECACSGGCACVVSCFVEWGSVLGARETSVSGWGVSELARIIIVMPCSDP